MIKIKSLITQISRPNRTAEEIKNSSNLALVGKATALMNRINALGGTKAIVPTQGIVFTFKGNIYKAVGLFSDINQILGALKYAG